MIGVVKIVRWCEILNVLLSAVYPFKSFPVLMWFSTAAKCDVLPSVKIIILQGEKYL